MKKVLRQLTFLGLFLILLSMQSTIYADAAYDAGYQVGQAIAQNMFEPSMQTIPTEEYIDPDFNAGNIQTIFFFAMIPRDCAPFIESDHAVTFTTGIMTEGLREKGFKTITPRQIGKTLTQSGVNVDALDSTQLANMVYTTANRIADATCKVEIISYRMVPWRNTAKAEATLRITVTDQKTGTEIYSYTRQTLRANLPLARNDPSDMIKKISKEFSGHFAKKVAADRKKL